MYTNIDPDEGIATIEKYLQKFNKTDIPTEFILKLLRLVMENNIFQFGNTFWRQNIGTAMGTPCACVYATLFYAYFEQTYILPKYKNNILFYVRTIDDIFCVWNDNHTNHTNNPNTQNNTFNQLKQDLDNQCKLTWNTKELSNQTNFLDLTITIDKNGYISTKTYQKPMNVFLYIPSNSAHPPGMIKSLIFGLLQTYYYQNTYKKDFLHNTYYSAVYLPAATPVPHSKNYLQKLQIN